MTPKQFEIPEEEVFALRRKEFAEKYGDQMSGLAPGWRFLYKTSTGFSWGGKINEKYLFARKKPTPEQVALWDAKKPDFEENPDDNFCLARVVCKTDKKKGIDDTAEGQRVGAELHKTYFAWGWKTKKGFVLHTRQCDATPLNGQMFCKNCQAKQAKSGSPSRTQWYGVYGEIPAADAHCRGSQWADVALGI